MTSRRSFLQSAGLTTAAALCYGASAPTDSSQPLQEFDYGAVQLAPGLAQTQFQQTQSVLLSLNDDNLLKPWRTRAGLPAPGAEMGGWYDAVPQIKLNPDSHGFAPGSCFGQWISALSRRYAVDRDPQTHAKLERLLALYEPAISEKFYANFRFPAYTYDKMVIGLIDAQRFAGIASAHRLLDKTTDAAEPHLPPHALDRDKQRAWRESIGENTAVDYTWDESYTLPENLYLAWERGAGDRYRKMARRFLLDQTYFDPLSENKNVLPGHHAYSFCNALSSAMQAYLADGSQKHLRAASNGFRMIAETQSYATGGWGPNESFVVPNSGKLYASLSETHHGFETPCGSYGHFKITRYLLRVTRDGSYGDSMERVFYNTVLGAKPLQRDGSAFYYSDYHFDGNKVYFPDKWPCCSGTLPQVSADYHVASYFHDHDGVFVNLYQPSMLRWVATDGAQLSLTQSGNYPVEGNVSMRLRASRPSSFALRLRIPAWSPGAVIRLNGQRVTGSTQKGFATLHRTWKDGDRVDLALTLPLRLEAIDKEHPNTVALLRGPLVLFAMGNHAPAITREQLLQAKQVPQQTVWRVESNSRSLSFRPFTAIEDEHYNTYVNIS